MTLTPTNFVCVVLICLTLATFLYVRIQKKKTLIVDLKLFVRELRSPGGCSKAWEKFDELANGMSRNHVLIFKDPDTRDMICVEELRKLAIASLTEYLGASKKRLEEQTARKPKNPEPFELETWAGGCENHRRYILKLQENLHRLRVWRPLGSYYKSSTHTDPLSTT